MAVVRKKKLIFSSYIKSIEDKIVDKQSRVLKPETEWELCSQAFKKIVHNIGCPSINYLHLKVIKNVTGTCLG